MRGHTVPTVILSIIGYISYSSNSVKDPQNILLLANEIVKLTSNNVYIKTRRRKLLAYINIHIHRASKDRLCKSTIDLVSLNGQKAVLYMSGFLFPLPLLYFLLLC